jgi:hypothetical protein
MKGMAGLAKFVLEEGYAENGNGTDTGVLALLNHLAHEPESEWHKKLLWRKVMPQMIQRSLLGNPYMPYPSKEEFQGDVEAGLVGLHEPYTSLAERAQALHAQGIQPIVARFDANLLSKHLFAAGATGQGKTTLLYQLIFQFHRQLGLNFITLSFKRDMRHLIRHIPNLLVFRVGNKSNFKANVFAGDLAWLIKICRIFSETLSLGIGAESMLYEFGSKLLRQNRLTARTLRDEVMKVQLKVFRDVNWKASLLNRLSPFTDIFWKILNTDKGLPLEKLLEHYSLDFELDQAAEYKSFWSTLFPVSLYEHRIQNNLRGNKLVTPILIDEALSIASKEIQRSGVLGDPTFFQMVRMGREFGTGFAFMSSQPSEMSDTIKTNTVLKVLMPMGRFEELLDLGRSMNLSKEQLEFTSHLLPGQAIMQIGNIIKPFPVTFPRYDIQKDVTDEEIDEHNAKLLRGTEFEYLTKEEPEAIVLETKEELSQDEKAFLFDVYNRPYLSIKERMESVSL